MKWDAKGLGYGSAVTAASAPFGDDDDDVAVSPASDQQAGQERNARPAVVQKIEERNAVAEERNVKPSEMQKTEVRNVRPSSSSSAVHKTEEKSHQEPKSVVVKKNNLLHTNKTEDDRDVDGKRKALEEKTRMLEEERKRLVQEQHELSRAKQQVLQKKNKIVQMKASLEEERQKLQEERDFIEREKAQLAMERTEFEERKNRLYRIIGFFFITTITATSCFYYFSWQFPPPQTPHTTQHNQCTDN